MIWRWISTTAALFVAVTIVPGITFDGPILNLFLVAAVFGLVNALLKPIVTLLTCPLVVLTFGLFTFVINALMLLVTSSLSARWGLGFSVASFWPAFWGGLLIGIVNTILSVGKAERRSPPEA